MASNEDEKNLNIDDIDSEANSGSLDATNDDEDAITSIFGEEDDHPVAKATIISEDTDSTEIEDPGTGTDDEPVFSDKEEAESEEEAEEETETTNNRGLFVKVASIFIHRIQWVVGLLFGAIGFSLLALLGFLPGGDSQENVYSPQLQVYVASIESDTADVFFFDRFLVLLGEDDEKAYLILNLSITPSNGQVYKEVRQKRTLCRDAIFRVLTKAVRETKEIVGERIKNDIAAALNDILVSGKIENVAFGEFLIV